MVFVAKHTKYRPKFAKELRNGIRREGLTIEDCCEKWGTTRQTYYNWLDAHKEFAIAHEFGERDFHNYWTDIARQAATGQKKVNAGVLNLVLANFLGFSTKVESKSINEEQIHTINIKVIEGRKQPLLIEHDDIHTD